MKTMANIAIRQLLDRKRQSLVSFLGIVLGVAFFLAISSIMQGSQNDFIRRLIDNSPHITIVDEYRNPRIQPIERAFPGALTSISSVKPMRETRGIRGYGKILSFLSKRSGVRSSPVLLGQGILSFSAQDSPVTLNGMLPEEIVRVTTIGNYMLEGEILDLQTNSNGIIIGAELARSLSIHYGDVVNATVSSDLSSGLQAKTFTVVGIFRTGRSSFDKSQVFIAIERAQALLNRPRRINSILVKMLNPYDARVFASEVESRFAYKSISWQESSEDIMSTLTIRNTIMYTVVSAVLVVAAFGIYNVISTVVMEKYRDIAILKSMGFYPSDIRSIFAIQGLILGVLGCILGVPLGMAFMLGLSQVSLKPHGGSEIVFLPVDWGIMQFVIAVVFALASAFAAAYFPAKKAGSIQPVTILRGGM